MPVAIYQLYVEGALFLHTTAGDAIDAVSARVFCSRVDPLLRGKGEGSTGKGTEGNALPLALFPNRW